VNFGVLGWEGHQLRNQTSSLMSCYHLNISSSIFVA
jgi:hypothetical protein